MNRDDIIRMAREARLCDEDGRDSDSIVITGYLERFAALVAAAEREACIELLEDFSKTRMVPVVDTWRMGLIAGANAMRQRGAP
jgi:hypothetical protein